MRPSRALAVFGTFLVIALFAVTALAVWYLRGAALVDEQRRLSQLDLVLSEQASRAIEEVNLLLTSSEEKLRAMQDASGQSGPERVDAHALHEMLAQQSAGMTQVRGLFIVDSAGFGIADARVEPAPALDVSERSFFAAQRAAGAGVFISEPFTGRVNGHRSVAMSRRLQGPDGSFRGIIGATIDPEHFEAFYESLGLGEGGTIALYRQDGTYLAGYSDRPATGLAVVFRDDAFVAARR
ncbi:MAG: hypothetical protein JO128_23845, partial [Alphaproteobacteria bacterium]|nr:hypothetical protein [Alphaproteobacteria bacterium]